MKHLLNLLIVIFSVIGIGMCAYLIWYIFSVVFPMLGVMQMIKFENTITPSADQWNAILLSMRNPLNSWNKSDSYPAVDCGKCGKIEREGMCKKEDRDCTGFECYEIGPNDLDLMKRLRNAGTDHRKFMRMITVYTDITAPLYWQFFLPMKHFSQLSLGVTFVANGEPPIGIPWETHLYSKCEPVETIPYALWAGEQGYYLYVAGFQETKPMKTEMVSYCFIFVCEKNDVKEKKE